MFPVAVVTGATRGIGRAIVQNLSAHGISCVAIGSSLESVMRLRSDLKFTSPHQMHRTLAIDLCNWPQWTECKRFPGLSFSSDGLMKQGEYPIFDSGSKYYIDLLVNCAGRTQTSLGLKTSPTQMKELMNLNFLSCVSLINLSTRHMIRTVHRNASTTTPCIISISSILENVAIPGTTIYSASKAALSQYTKVLAQETATWGIRAVALPLGLVRETDMIQDLDTSIVDALKNLPSQTPKQVADTVWSIYHREGTDRAKLHENFP
ncbi:hypothetical protein KAFR_0I01650 [Kazachstania africana CBS 2517]|uniref:Ketoreductase (KR) domain-containing protein n=1 Tax=Kazachstania africana (strain ATCC 22294 / BCRC 22015 / CBS 2517 / CECT 1963 / NBRC 1671 / NRRL Y-8276) TaxID=1071382 RepID=H2AZZ6_KAZAF|nr:hypothetical protein KAFR_0I01650 [Kazachstania africana CBS 2517]CCF59946.1 hypothetical protein KAFR_0I01650 [Kazachstania africana CBS 2517]